MTILTHLVTTLVAILAVTIFPYEWGHLYYQMCAFGFSGVLFALKVCGESFLSLWLMSCG